MSSQAHTRSPFVYRAPIVRWIDYARRSWQRLGFIKVLASLASPSDTITLQGITRRFESEVTSLQEIPDDLRSQVSEYAQVHRTNRYRTNSKTLDKAELQDLYLSAPDLPSNSGAITGDMEAAGYRHAVYVEIPAWAVRLRILRTNNYTLTDRGKALLALGGIDLNATHSFSRNINPLFLIPGERFFFLYCLLDSDGDLIKPLYTKLLAQHEFSRTQAGERAAEVLRNLLAKRLRYPSSGATRLIAERMASTVKSVKNQGKGMGPKESLGTPRTEPLVDCGIIERVDKSNYMYRIPDKGSEFIASLASTESIDEFLEMKLARTISQLLGYNIKVPRKDFPAEIILKQVVQSYADLRSGLGYCSIRELALLAVGRGLNKGSPIFEINDAEKAIWQAVQEYGTAVRLTKSRQGNIALVRMDMRLVKELLHAE